MRKCYRLAKLKTLTKDHHATVCFGPVLTLTQAEHWQRELSIAGKECVIINTESV